MKTKLKFITLTTNALVFVGVANADGIAWADLSQDQRGLLAEHAEIWDRMGNTRQEQIATGAERWLAMDQNQKRQAHGRFQQWENLPPEARDRIQDTYRRFQRLPPDRRLELQRQFRGLTADQLRRLRDTRLRPNDRPSGGAMGMGMGR